MWSNRLGAVKRLAYAIAACLVSRPRIAISLALASHIAKFRRRGAEPYMGSAGMFEIVERRVDGAFEVLATSDEPAGLPGVLESLKAAGFTKAFIRKRAPSSPPSGDEEEPWHARERERFATGTYRAVPWAKCSINKPEHYAHFSLDAPGMVAFTPSAEHGRLDRQLRVRIGRYLEHWLLLEADDVRYWTDEFRRQFPATVRFASSADEIERVYTHGPNSCMSHSASHYNTRGIHPTRVYAAGDLQIAYIGADDDDERITARCVVWPARKLCSWRIYGDEAVLERALRDLGYKQGNFGGARLARIPCGDTYIMPYLDGIQSVDDDGDCFIIAEDGEYSAANTDGLLEDCGRRCANCDCRIGTYEYYANPDGDTLCEDCYCELCTSCNRCDNDIFRDDSITVDGDDWCEHCANRHATQCAHCGDYTTDPNTVDSDDAWCADCVRQNATWCDDCDGYFSEAHDHTEDDESDSASEREREPSPRVEDERQGELAI